MIITEISESGSCHDFHFHTLAMKRVLSSTIVRAAWLQRTRYVDARKGYSSILVAATAGAVLLSLNLCQPTEAKAAIEQSPQKTYSSSFKTELLEFLEPDQVELNIEDLIQRGKPWNSYHKSNYFPDMIIYPRSTEQVSKIVKLCNKYSYPVVPFGGGTSLEGQTIVTAKGGVSLDFNQMKNIIELNEDDLDVRVEAGLGYVELNEILKSKGLWFPLDPGPGASIGGMLIYYCIYHIITFLFLHINVC